VRSDGLEPPTLWSEDK